MCLFTNTFLETQIYGRKTYKCIYILDSERRRGTYIGLTMMCCLQKYLFMTLYPKPDLQIFGAENFDLQDAATPILTRGFFNLPPHIKNGFILFARSFRIFRLPRLLVENPLEYRYCSYLLQSGHFSIKTFQYRKIEVFLSVQENCLY